MFDALEVSLLFLEKLGSVEAKIRTRSAGLTKQLSEASDSIALNIAEGRLRRGGDQRHHYAIAAGSASEVTVALRIALARRFVAKADLEEVDALLDRVRAMLYRLTH